MVDGVLRVRVSAPPTDGAANDALMRLIAHELAVAPREVRLVLGAHARTKLIGVTGIARERVLDRWPTLEV